MEKKLENKIAVVTGGTSGIGLATTREFVAQGAKLILTGRKPEEVNRTATEMQATGIVSDQGQTFLY